MPTALNKTNLNLNRQISLKLQIIMNKIGLHQKTVGVIHQHPLQALLVGLTSPCDKESHSLVFRQIWSISFWLSILLTFM